MNMHEFMNTMLAAFPKAVVEQALDGQLVIYTNLTPHPHPSVPAGEAVPDTHMIALDMDVYDFDYTEEEERLLKDHDVQEELHAYEATNPGGTFALAADYSCRECGDTEEGLMHNNTWRNVEPLL